MSQKYDLSVIIASYNAAPFIQDCLTSLKSQQGLKLQIIVVDNASTDDTVKLIQQNFKDVILVKRDVSFGFSAANNAGVILAKADHLLFLNPDTKFIHPGDLKQCLDKYKATPKLGTLTCRVNLFLTKDIDVTCHRGFPTPWAAFTYFSGLAKLFSKSPLFGRYLMSYLDYTKEHPVDAVGGMFMLVSRQVGDSIGWWDEDYPLYGEDIDFCYRLHQQGLINLYWPQVTLLHYKGASTGMYKPSQSVTTASKTTTKQVKIWSIEAMEIFYTKHYRLKYPFFLNWLVFIGLKLLKYKRTHHL